jgi:hypothetical protein
LKTYDISGTGFNVPWIIGNNPPSIHPRNLFGTAMVEYMIVGLSQLQNWRIQGGNTPSEKLQQIFLSIQFLSVSGIREG